MSTPDCFRSRLDAMIDLRHPLAVLATRMPWASIEATCAPIFERRARGGRVSEGIDLFGATSVLTGAGSSAEGRPMAKMFRHLCTYGGRNEMSEAFVILKRKRVAQRRAIAAGRDWL